MSRRAVGRIYPYIDRRYSNALPIKGHLNTAKSQHIKSSTRSLNSPKSISSPIKDKEVLGLFFECVDHLYTFDAFKPQQPKKEDSSPISNPSQFLLSGIENATETQPSLNSRTKTTREDQFVAGSQSKDLSRSHGLDPTRPGYFKHQNGKAGTQPKIATKNKGYMKKTESMRRMENKRKSDSILSKSTMQILFRPIPSSGAEAFPKPVSPFPTHIREASIAVANDKSPIIKNLDEETMQKEIKKTQWSSIQSLSPLVKKPQKEEKKSKKQEKKLPFSPTLNKRAFLDSLKKFSKSPMSKNLENSMENEKKPNETTKKVSNTQNQQRKIVHSPSSKTGGLNQQNNLSSSSKNNNSSKSNWAHHKKMLNLRENELNFKFTESTVQKCPSPMTSNDLPLDQTPATYPNKKPVPDSPYSPNENESPSSNPKNDNFKSKEPTSKFSYYSKRASVDVVNYSSTKEKPKEASEKEKNGNNVYVLHDYNYFLPHDPSGNPPIFKFNFICDKQHLSKKEISKIFSFFSPRGSPKNTNRKPFLSQESSFMSQSSQSDTETDQTEKLKKKARQFARNRSPKSDPQNTGLISSEILKIKEAKRKMQKKTNN